MIDQKLFDKVVSYRREFHENPELSFQEYKTTEFIQNKLKELGVKTLKLAETGVIGIIGEDGPIVALRADIDALPVCEETHLEYASKNIGVMHACGHDLHTASLLGAAEILKSKESELKGRIYLIFQPAEEKLPGGAKQALDAGLFKDEKPEYIFAWHIFPQEEVGAVCVAPGYVMAATDEIYIDILGKGAHAAQPHLAHDPILAASELVLSLQSIISRNRNPLNPAVLTITSFNSGNTTNIIPEKAELKGTLRTYQPEFRATALARIEEIVKNVCTAHECDYKLNIVNGYPSLKNDAKAVEILENAVIKLFGEASLKDFEPKMWAEDFSYFAQEIPACFFFLGVKPRFLDVEMPALHNPRLSPNEEALKYAVEIMAEMRNYCACIEKKIIYCNLYFFRRAFN